MTLYDISLTNHSGYPWFKWKSDTTPGSIVNTVRYTRYPTFSLKDQRSKFELECGYMAAMSMSARNQGIEIMSIKKRPLSVDTIKAEGTEQDIIFDITVDMFMNETNLSYRMVRTVEDLIYTKDRNLLESKEITEEEKTQIVEVFNDIQLQNIIDNNFMEIFECIRNALEEVKDIKRDFDDYCVLGVGMLSSSYNILFYQGLKGYLDLLDKDLDGMGFFPTNEVELAKMLNITQMPTYIEPGESELLYPSKTEYNFVIRNLNVGPKVLGVVEPFHLIVGVKSKYPYESILYEILRSIRPYLNE